MFCFILSLAGCYSMQPQTIKAEDIDKQKEYEIYSLTLKDSSKIDIKESGEINYIKDPAESTGRFIVGLSDSVYIIPLNNVSKIDIVKFKTDQMGTTLAIALVAFCIGGIIILINSWHFELGH